MRKKLIVPSRFERISILILLAVLAGSVSGGIVGVVTQSRVGAQTSTPTTSNR
jgi:hypothetical protein